jgi:hypothetical protein
MKRFRPLSAPLYPVLMAVLATGCGGGAIPAADPSRASGQSALMGGTFAGKNACNAQTHDKPFIIEWDATDMASFEGRAANDVVFVRYEGCDLQVLDACANDSIHGALGDYRPAEWTSGSIEKVDIANEGELYAKLPLSVVTLGGRVKAGETFQMQYFVSGVRTATRSAVYRGDLDAIPGCKGATHFVYGYALGAFALASGKDVSGEAGVSAGAVGAGGSRSHTEHAEKIGGQLDTCRNETAKETKTCQVPIRLMLRPVAEGKDPNPPTATTASPAGAPAGPPPSRSDNPNITADETKLRSSAIQKRNLHDGKGCLDDLDAADRQFPNSPGLSTREGSGYLYIRATCLMLAGKCDVGRDLERRHWLATSPSMPRQTIDTLIQNDAGQYCPK